MNNAYSPQHENSVNKVHTEPPPSISITSDCGTYFLSSPFFSKESCIPIKDFFKISTWLKLATKKFTCQTNKICSVCQQSVTACQHGFLFCHMFHSCPVSLMCLFSDPSSDFLPVLILKVTQPPWGCISGRLNIVHKKFYNFLSCPQCFRGVLWYPYLRLRDLRS